MRDEASVAYEQTDGERNKQVAELGARRTELESELPELHGERHTVSSECPRQILAVLRERATFERRAGRGADGQPGVVRRLPVDGDVSGDAAGAGVA